MSTSYLLLTVLFAVKVIAVNPVDIVCPADAPNVVNIDSAQFLDLKCLYAGESISSRQEKEGDFIYKPISKEIKKVTQIRFYQADAVIVFFDKTELKFPLGNFFEVGNIHGRSEDFRKFRPTEEKDAYNNIGLKTLVRNFSKTRYNWEESNQPKTINLYLDSKRNQDNGRCLDMIFQIFEDRGKNSNRREWNMGDKKKNSEKGSSCN